MTDPVKPKEGEEKDPEIVDVQAQIDAAVQKAVEPIKTNRDSILTEKREMKTALDAALLQVEKLGGSDGIESLLSLKERLEKDELGRLIADGKHDEWFDTRTSAMRADHENQLGGVQTKLEEAETRAQAAELRYTGLRVENEVRTACSKSEGFVESAIGDALLRATSVFAYDAERGVVIKDENGGVTLGKDGSTPKSVSEWLEEQKETLRHWWGQSQGAGLDGSTGGGGPRDASMEAVGKMTADEYKEYRKKKGLTSGYGVHIP